ncbi:hypothetical protein [Mycoplasma parvum]|uniref:Uncharacterized protein n=1 Tax=Mycoplasma parvum str. Indiana TaxID=1403316 RepID=U5NCI3_9MOLU|nr:hypothetical protein [Mycoplasma parvum]AGX89137.1 hypothetical protein PRV_01995 [Mycoplasma parvum str. Indiana]
MFFCFLSSFHSSLRGFFSSGEKVIVDSSTATFLPSIFKVVSLDPKNPIKGPAKIPGKANKNKPLLIF